MNSSKVEFRDNCIDLIRLIAAIVVMFSHSLRWFGVEKPVWGLFFTDGSVGVISFNVLSGFLIFASWERCKNSFGSVTSQIKKYVCNRCFRIYPALFFSCILICIFDFLVKNEELIINAKTPLNIFMYCVAAIHTEPIEGGYSNGVLWTLFNEIILYCVIPVFYNLLRKLNKTQFIVLILVCWVLNWADHFIINISQTKHIFEILGGGMFPIIMYEYLIGIFVYCFKEDIIPFLRDKKFLAVSIAIWSVWYYIYNYTGLFSRFGEMHNPIFGITLPWIVLGIAYRFKIKLKFDISYGIYLFHMPVVWVMIDITSRSNIFLPFVWMIVIMIAGLSCVFIEQPFMRLKTKIISNVIK